MGEILKKEFLGNRKKLFLIILAVVVLSITAVGYIMTFNKVTIIDGEEVINVKTRKNTVKEVLEQEGISYIEEDYISPLLDSEVEDNMEVVIKRAVNITIEADGETIKLLTPAEDVAAAIREAGLSLKEKDKITPSLSEKLRGNLRIEITRAIPCSIEVEGKKIQLLTIAPNVEEALKEAKITLGELDKISPGLEEKLKEDTIIKIVRVTQETKTIKEDIGFKTIKEKSKDLYKGETKTVKKGQKGVVEKEVKITYEDGKEVKIEVIEEKVLKEPVDKVVKVGTKALPPLQVSRGNGEVVRTLKVIATAYSPEDPGVGNRTSLGLPLRKGVIAVDPRIIPYRTKLYVPGYGFGEALDTGGAIKGNRIDVAFMTRKEALKFGRKTLTIKIYGK